MKLLTRNKQTIYYALYDEDTYVTETDEYGNVLQTGEHKVTYKDPVKLRVSLSPASGSAQEDVFGTDITYSKVMIAEGNDCPIDENSVLWLDGEPEYDDDGCPVYQYKIAAVARSLNFTSYAIRKREVS